MSKSTSSSARRRDFLAATALAAAGVAGGNTQAQEERAKKARLGIALIGAGNRGTSLFRDVQRAQREGTAIDMVAVCDAYRPRLEKAVERYGGKPYRTPEELLKDPNVDAVFVATPDRLHAYHALQAIRAGKDVYCEKPLTHWAQFDKLKEMVKEARAHKTIFQMGTQRVSDPMYHIAKARIERGGIGKPIHVITGLFRKGDFGERGMPIDDPKAQAGPDLNWEAFLGDAPQRPFDVSRFFRWRLYMDYSGGPVTDLYPHLLAPIVYTLGLGFPKRVMAIGAQYAFHGEREVPDTFDMLAEYPEGITLSVLGSQANGSNIDPMIRGTAGAVTFRESNVYVDPEPPTQNPRVDLPSFNFVYEHVRNFLGFVRTRQQPDANVEVGYHTQTALIMAMQSHITGKVARFDQDSEQIKFD